MRALFMISDGAWNASARAFVLAARGLAARGHEVRLACAAECPVQVRAKSLSVPLLSLGNATSAAATLELRRQLQDVDAVFVHSDRELVAAGSALALRRGAGHVIRRIPPFEIAAPGRGARIVSRFAVTTPLYSTSADRDAAGGVGALAPLGVDFADHDAATPVAKTAIGVPAKARLIVCVYDGQKGNVLSALRTLALLSPRHGELHMAVIGAERPDELRMHGAALGINSLVTFLGARDDELSVIKAADIGWIAATGDAAAFAALDFSACRIALLAERTPLTEHYVADGIAGVLLPPADPHTTAASVAAFLAKDDARKAMGKVGRARVEREFSLESMINGYEEAIAGRARSTRTVA